MLLFVISPLFIFMHTHTHTHTHTYIYIYIYIYILKIIRTSMINNLFEFRSSNYMVFSSSLMYFILFYHESIHCWKDYFEMFLSSIFTVFNEFKSDPLDDPFEVGREQKFLV